MRELKSCFDDPNGAGHRHSYCSCHNGGNECIQYWCLTVVLGQIALRVLISSPPIITEWTQTYTKKWKALEGATLAAINYGD